MTVDTVTVDRRSPRPAALSVTVHGPAGVLDLLVPGDAAVGAVAREYAAQARLPVVLRLHTLLGERLGPGQTLAEVCAASGVVLVAAGAPPPVRAVVGLAGTGHGWRSTQPGRLSLVWCAVAVAAAALAGWCAAHTAGPTHRLTVLLLAGTAVLGVLPVGSLARHRAAAPAFAAAATFAVMWVPAAEALPSVVGSAGLAAAATAGLARALDSRADEVLRVWVVSGASLFVVTWAASLSGAGPPTVWSALLLVAVLAARFVPALAVGLPDQCLTDQCLTDQCLGDQCLSDHEHAVPAVAVEEVAASASRTVTAAAVAICALAAVSGPMLLSSATLPVDRTGARVLVALAGGALLLAAGGHRHRGARLLLRAAGLTCWAAILAVLLGLLDDRGRFALAVVVVALGSVLVAAAVVVGRGWRSTRWSRYADVAEDLAGAGALGALVVSSGFFRFLWETQLRV